MREIFAPRLNRRSRVFDSFIQIMGTVKKKKKMSVHASSSSSVVFAASLLSIDDVASIEDGPVRCPRGMVDDQRQKRTRNMSRCRWANTQMELVVGANWG